MARLEEITVGASIKGVLPDGLLTVVAVEWIGTVAINLTYRDAAGQLGSELLYRDREPTLEVAVVGRPWSFDGDGGLFRLVTEAHRIQLAYLFDPLLAVHTSLVEPLPHQITAVYGEMLPRQPLRLLLADDPGAGKTIMTGLYIKELAVRGDLERCLIVCPGNLAEQWQDELHRRFHLPFEIMTNDALEAARTGNWFSENRLAICRLDKLSRNEDVQLKLRQTDWDLIVCDEAHKMSATYFGSEVKYTKRYRLGQLLSTLTRHFLLLTATPHNGKEADFQLFMALLDGDRFEGKFRDGVHVADASDLMRRLVKEQLLKFDGTPLFPERLAYSVNYNLSDAEAELYREVTDYVREEFNRAEALESGGQKGTVGFALTILQRRLASSPEAIYQSLRRRRERLQKRLREAQLHRRGGPGLPVLELSDLPAALARRAGEGPVDPDPRLRVGLVFTDDDLDDLDDAPDAEVEEAEERVVDQASAARTIAELQTEIGMLQRLEGMALAVRQSNTDRKWDELSRLLQNNSEMFDAHGHRRKLVIFTEHRDTLNYLAERIRALLGKPEAVVIIHGGVGREERKKSQEAFTQDKEVEILVATDAAGEGINLQRAHLMVNYDLPWNPNRLEQRFGRIHRIGQTEVCHLWNLVAKETREGDVYLRLLEKLEEERKALGGQVFDVLGQLRFDDRPLRELLLEAVRYGDRPDVRARLYEVVDNALDRDHLRELVEGRALVHDSMDISRVNQIREDMERADARRLQPHFIAAFFIEAFQLLGGTIHEREAKRYEIKHVPAVIRTRDREIGRGEPVLQRYERVTFDKSLISVPGKPLAAFVCPGHPLLDSTIDIVIERHRDLLKRGAVLIDETDPGDQVRALLFLEHSIQDARTERSGKRRVVSKRLQFIELCGVGVPPAIDHESPAAGTAAPQPQFEFTDPRTTPFVEPRSRGNLPHFYKEGGSYFVTFRLWDAIVPKPCEPCGAGVPPAVQRGLPPAVPKNPAAGTAAPQVNRPKTREEIAAESEPPLRLGSCLLAREDIAEIVQNAVKHFHGGRYFLHSWCVMPNHVHVVYTALGEHTPADIHHSWKSYTSHKVNKLLSRTDAFWESESFDHLVRSVEDLEWFIEYTESNPVAARFCARPNDWRFSSAGDDWQVGKATCGVGVPPAQAQQGTAAGTATPQNRQTCGAGVPPADQDRRDAYTTRSAGPAPYLDYRPPTADEQPAIATLSHPEWLRSDLERNVLEHAAMHLVPAHFDEVRQRKEALIDKTVVAVKDRLTKEINHWDHRAAQLKEQELAGKVNARLNSGLARQRADDLTARLQSRLAELEQERRLSPLSPVVLGGALIVPLGLLRQLRGDHIARPPQFAINTERSEKLAMAAVMQAERDLGYEPRDVSDQKLGYDIESAIPGTGRLRFIEVKGRVVGALTITVTKNEILTALNKPDDFILAIARVDVDRTEVSYIRQPFENEPDFTVTSVNFNLDKLLVRGQSPN